MSGRGGHFALNDQELSALRAAGGLEEIADYVSNVIEQEKLGSGSSDACETDKSWAYIHSALTGADPDGDLEIPRFGKPPRRSVFRKMFSGKTAQPPPPAEAYIISGTEALLSSDDYYIGFIPADRVRAVSAGLETIDADALALMVVEEHRRYDASGVASDAADYAKGWFPGLVSFYRHAADTNKHVIFTVDF